MSWDVLIVNRGGATGPGVADEPTGPLGRPDEVRQRISDALPGVDWSQPDWGVYETDDYTIEFDVGDDDVVNTVLMHVGGGGDIGPALSRLAQDTNWSLLDTTTGEYLDSHQPSTASWKASQQPEYEEHTGEVQTVLAEMTEGATGSLPGDTVNNDSETATAAESMSGSSEPLLLGHLSSSLGEEGTIPEPLAPLSAEDLKEDDDEDDLEPTLEDLMAEQREDDEEADLEETDSEPEDLPPPRKAAPKKAVKAPPKKAAARTPVKSAAPRKAAGKPAPAKKKAAKAAAKSSPKKAAKKAAAKAAKKTSPAKKSTIGKKAASRKAPMKKAAVKSAKKVAKKVDRPMKKAAKKK